jgi:hypothetical protein
MPTYRAIMRKDGALVAAVLLATTLQAAFAQQPGGAGGTAAAAPGRGAAASTAQLVATVEAVDAAVRSLSLRGPQGDVQTLRVVDEIRTLSQVKIGDRVVVTYALALALQLKKIDAKIPEVARREGEADDAPVERPASAVGREMAVVADVVAVNYIKQTMTLRGPNRTVRLVVPDAMQLRSITTGDQVHATYAEAFAVALRVAPRTSVGE